MTMTYMQKIAKKKVKKPKKKDGRDTVLKAVKFMVENDTYDLFRQDVNTHVKNFFYKHGTADVNVEKEKHGYRMILEHQGAFYSTLIGFNRVATLEQGSATTMKPKASHHKRRAPRA